jgi:hypothetical protein
LHEVLDVHNREDLLRKALCLGWFKKEQFCFHGTDIEIPQHPNKKKVKKNNFPQKRKAVNL